MAKTFQSFPFSLSFRSSSGTRVLKFQRYCRTTRLSHFLTLSHTLAPISGTISPKTSGTLLLSLPSKANSRHFFPQSTIQLSNIVFTPPIKMCVCVCVVVCGCGCQCASVCLCVSVCVSECVCVLVSVVWCGVCVCVCVHRVFHVVMLEPLLMSV